MKSEAARLPGGLKLWAVALSMALVVSATPAGASVWSPTDRPHSGVDLTDGEINEATEWLHSADIDIQFKGIERLVPYFGRYPFVWWGYTYIITYSHKPTRTARAALGKPRAVSLILRCLETPEPAMKIWAMWRARRQNLLSGRMSFTAESIRELLDADGLIIGHNIKQQMIRAVETLRKDKDEHVRAEAIHLRAEVSSGRRTISASYARPYLDDESAVVRARCWSILTMACSANYGAVMSRPKLKPTLTRLRRDIPAPDWELARAVLGFVNRAGSNVHGSRKMRRPDNERYWQRILDGCEDSVLKRLEAWKGAEHMMVENALFSACRWYPKSEPLLIRALAKQEGLHAIVTSLSAMGTEASIAPLAGLTSSVKDDEGLVSSAGHAIDRIRERVERATSGSSWYHYSPQYIDASKPGVSAVFYKMVRRHGLGTRGSAVGTTLQIRDTPENGYRWRVLMTMLDTPAWEKTFKDWDGSDLLEGVRLQWQTEQVPAQAPPDVVELSSP